MVSFVGAGHLGGEGTEIDRLELDYQVYDPLTEDEVSKFIESLKSRFPLATDFRSKEPAERDPTSRHRRITGMKDIYTPASDDEITEYTETTYPAWVESCRKTLADLHGDMQREIGPPAICFVSSNEGTRPGKDALTTIQASGNFKICPPDPDENDRQEEESETKIELPPPPDPPQGKWTTTFGGRHRNALTGMAAFEAMQKSLFPFAAVRSVDRHMPDIDFSALHRECQRRSKSTPLAGVKMHHLMRFSPALAVVPVVHRRDPRCFV